MNGKEGAWSAPKAANDNYTPEELAQTDNTVVSFTGKAYEREPRVVIDGQRLAALRQKVADVYDRYPFLLNTSTIETAKLEVSNLTTQDIIRMVNAINPAELEESKAGHYKALLARLDEPGEHI